MMATDRIKAGWPNPQRNTFKTPFELAAQSLRHEAQLELEYTPFLGVEAEVADLRNGTIDLGFMTLPQIAYYSQQGMALRIVLGFLQRHTFRVVTASSIQSVEDLRGKLVCIQPGTGIAGLAMHLTLHAAGLHLGHDVKTCDLMPIPDIETAMAADSIAGCPVGVDTAFHMQRNHPGKFVIQGASSLETLPPMLVVAWVTTQSILQERRPKLQHFVSHLGAAYGRAYELGAAELAKVAKTMEFLTDYHLDDLEASLRVYLRTEVWPIHGAVTRAHWNSAVEVYRKAGALTESIEFERVQSDILPG